jgi:hypothetical protein
MSSLGYKNEFLIEVKLSLMRFPAFQMMYETEKFRICLIANEGWVPILASLACSSLSVREAAVAAILCLSESEQSHSKLVQGGAIAW